jgi:hypothetical protein
MAAGEEGRLRSEDKKDWLGRGGLAEDVSVCRRQ